MWAGCVSLSLFTLLFCLLDLFVLTSKHAKPTDRLGRRYRDLDTNVFSIADEDDNG